MKNLLFFLLVSLCFASGASAQQGIEGQIGGGNFLGLTINSRFEIALSKTREHRLSPSIGLGILSPAWDAPTIIMNAGITYNYKSWGIGTEVAGFTENPFIPSTQPRDFADMIIYPNFNYTFTMDSSWYIRLSAGPYFAYSKSIDPVTEEVRLRFDGDVIPGAGIAVGYILK